MADEFPSRLKKSHFPSVALTVKAEFARHWREVGLSNEFE
jgi:hypothetical protein